MSTQSTIQLSALHDVIMERVLAQITANVRLGMEGTDVKIVSYSYCHHKLSMQFDHYITHSGLCAWVWKWWRVYWTKPVPLSSTLLWRQVSKWYLLACQKLLQLYSKEVLVVYRMISVQLSALLPVKMVASVWLPMSAHAQADGQDHNVLKVPGRSKWCNQQIPYCSVHTQLFATQPAWMEGDV